MKKMWKQTGAALLIAGLTVTGTNYALANEKETEPTIDLSQLESSTTAVVEDSPETVEVHKEEDVVIEDETDKEDGATEAEASDLPETPEGYTAGNLDALGKAHEKVQNPTAKASIKRNMERSIEKWENKQPETETPEQSEVVEVKEETPIKEDSVKEETLVEQEKPVKVKQGKAPQAELNAQHKEQRQELKANQKEEREALKEERKKGKEQQKQVEKEKKN